jgi:hypothetical protein
MAKTKTSPTLLTVHLLRAPDYEPDDYFSLCNLLTTLNLPGWQFIIPEKEIDPWEEWPEWGNGRRNPNLLRFNYHSPVEKMMYDRERSAPLSWRELFAVCDFYRDTNQVAPLDTVILLTSRRNALNWFGAFDEKRNAFVHTAEWENFIPCDAKYPIAYEVLATALRIPLGLHYQDYSPFVHEEPLGCVNDFCQHKKEIALKLRTGDICADCLEKLGLAEVPWLIVEGALQGFDHLRRQMLFFQRVRHTKQVGTLLVNDRYQLVLPDQGNLALKLGGLPLTLYLFFLKHPEGVSRFDLPEHRTELLRIYNHVSRLSNTDAMQKSIDLLISPTENSVFEKVSSANRSLKDTLGNELAVPFLIKYVAQKNNERYCIDLPADKVQWAVAI